MCHHWYRGPDAATVTGSPLCHIDSVGPGPEFEFDLAVAGLRLIDDGEQLEVRSEVGSLLEDEIPPVASQEQIFDPIVRHIQTTWKSST